MNAEKLERNAVEQRDRIERTSRELIDKVAHSKPSFQVRKHFARVSAIASIAAFVSGYFIAGRFRANR